MRFIPRALALVGVAAALLVGGVSAYAASNTTWNVSYSVAVATSLSEGSVDLALGPELPGVVSAPFSNTLHIISNDPAGFQITESFVNSSTETGTGCAGRIAQAAATSAPTAINGGSGGVAGTPVASFSATGIATNLFSAVPTVTSTSNMNEVINMTLTPSASAMPNSPGCVYSYPFTFTLIAQ